ncbi:MAG: leucyl aminopeptidase [Candidatus Azosocius agrarius]|nr:MAG: leucyl aminopeptidase [Gammaproteobacteria bacterium]
MKFNIITGPLEKQNASCIVTAIFNNNELSHLTKILDIISNNYISNTIKNLNNNENLNSLILYNVPNINSKKIILINCGNKNNLSKSDYKKIIFNSIKIIKTTQSKNILYLINNDCNIKNQNIFYNTKHLIININDILYKFNKYKTNNNNETVLKNIMIYSTKHEISNIQKSIKYGIIISKSIKYAKDLANTPPNICTPTYLANEVYNLSKIYKNLSVTIINKKEIKKSNMNFILSISKGSSENPKIIILKYINNSNQKPLILIGKGVTFDSGGMCLKSYKSMLGMKYDMCGASSILGVFIFILELKIKINIIGIIPSVENMINGKSIKPNDIIKSMSGKTIEILNTNAEGRLILCDALTYSQKYNPMIIIDIATLTGATITALGKNYNALYTNNSKLSNDLLIAGKMIDDICWKMPLSKKYNEKLKNTLADLSNVGDETGQSITAACFLSNFTTNTPWAHLDIAGTSTIKNNEIEEATGRPTKLLIQYIINLSSTFK